MFQKYVFNQYIFHIFEKAFKNVYMTTGFKIFQAAASRGSFSLLNELRAAVCASNQRQYLPSCMKACDECLDHSIHMGYAAANPKTRDICPIHSNIK